MDVAWSILYNSSNIVHDVPPMTKYQVKNYFDWGSLRLEPLQYLSIEQLNHLDIYTVTLDQTNKSIKVSQKALENQLKIGNIIKI